MLRATLAATVVAVVASTAAAPAAEAGPLRSLGTAEIRSVDGPGLLTITIGRRTLPARLHGVDLPRVGECGADETTAALQGFVRRARGKLSYALVKTKPGFRRDAAGRFDVIVAYRGRRAWRDFGDDLVRAGWGRAGEAVTGTEGARTIGRVPQGARRADRGDIVFAPPGRGGVWARCGGRVHLPIGEPVPASSAPVWTVDEFGVASAIGALSLSATLTPSGSLTLGGLQATAPTELSRWSFGCKASIPSLQLEAWSAASSGSCAQAPVLVLRPTGPDPARLSRGGGIGLPAARAQSGYPRLRLDDPAGWLSGERRQWAWQVAAATDEQDAPVVTDLLAYQAASLPAS